MEKGLVMAYKSMANTSHSHVISHVIIGYGNSRVVRVVFTGIFIHNVNILTCAF